jgi:Na+/proline symporter
MGLLSFGLAFRSESIKDLVEFASAFGSAGVFVVACFGLFTSVGGPLSAVAGLCTGFLVWLAGIALGWPAPYVTALVASCVVYLSTATFSRGTALTTTDVTGAATASTA